jgi:hypothetical protein
MFIVEPPSATTVPFSPASKLVGSVAGASLLIDYNSTNAAATALDLQVEAGYCDS